jgi:hypothetical protein
VKKDKETPYIYHLGTTAYHITADAAAFSDAELMKAAKSASYCKDFTLPNYEQVPRGQTGTLWRKVAA